MRAFTLITILSIHLSNVHVSSGAIASNADFCEGSADDVVEMYISPDDNIRLMEPEISEHFIEQYGYSRYSSPVSSLVGLMTGFPMKNEGCGLARKIPNILHMDEMVAFETKIKNCSPLNIQRLRREYHSRVAHNMGMIDRGCHPEDSNSLFRSRTRDMCGDAGDTICIMQCVAQRWHNPPKGNTNHADWERDEQKIRDLVAHLIRTQLQYWAKLAWKSDGKVLIGDILLINDKYTINKSSLVNSPLSKYFRRPDFFKNRCPTVRRRRSTPWTDENIPDALAALSSELFENENTNVGEERNDEILSRSYRSFRTMRREQIFNNAQSFRTIQRGELSRTARNNDRCRRPVSAKDKLLCATEMDTCTSLYASKREKCTFGNRFTQTLVEHFNREFSSDDTKRQIRKHIYGMRMYRRVIDWMNQRSRRRSRT
jgi:hypothetical protein